jgi:hypothetical protein
MIIIIIIVTTITSSCIRLHSHVASFLSVLPIIYRLLSQTNDAVMNVRMIAQEVHPIHINTNIAERMVVCTFRSTDALPYFKRSSS